MKNLTKKVKKTPQNDVNNSQGWLLFFYSIPSKPVSGRMKIWRKLAGAGAVQLKGAVYILPMTEEHYEFFQWLVSEVESLGGEAAFTSVRKIDSVPDQDIIDFFATRRNEEYQVITGTVEDIETRINSLRKGSKSQNPRGLSEQITKVYRRFEEVQKTDFFLSSKGKALRAKIDTLNVVLKGFSSTHSAKGVPAVARKRLGDYQGKRWVSRKRPFVDRMASAWLIKRFVDKSASFCLADEKEIASFKKDYVTFDVSGGDFTHIGDLCTFEILVRGFGIKDRVVRKIAEIVHELDIKDDKYHNAEARGVGEILSGLRKSIKDDSELLEKGMSVFEMLYRSKVG